MRNALMAANGGGGRAGRAWWRGVLPLGIGCLALVACGGVAESPNDDPTPPKEEEKPDTTTRDTTTRDTTTVEEPSTTSESATTGAVDPGSVTCPCSRRPGVNNSIKCARGVGEQVTHLVGPAGGLVSLHAQQGESSGVDFSIDIPPNSLTDKVEIEITETTQAPPADLIDYSPIYRVEPTDINAEFPMDLTLPFGGNDGLIPSTLAIYFAEDPEGPFEPISDSYINAGFLQGSTTRFGVFLAAATRTPAQAECP